VPGYDADQLTALGDYLPDLDEGRVRVAPPVDWLVAPRSKDYLARFLFDRNRRLSLPRITLDVRDGGPDDPRHLQPANLIEYTSSVSARMDENTRQALEGVVEPLQLGDVPCVRYVVHKNFRRDGKLVRADCEVLITICEGRVYTVSLDVFAGSLVDFRADAYAVVAGLRFPIAESADPKSGDPESGDPESGDAVEGPGGATSSEAEAGAADSGAEQGASSSETAP
jgi:hypothetical protein